MKQKKKKEKKNKLVEEIKNRWSDLTEFKRI